MATKDKINLFFMGISIEEYEECEHKVNLLVKHVKRQTKDMLYREVKRIINEDSYSFTA